MARAHICVGGKESTKDSWWVRDAQGIELCRVCEDCEKEKLARYRPEILSGYTQEDVNEPIEDLDAPSWGDFEPYEEA
jgi:hypothetical protein